MNTENTLPKSLANVKYLKPLCKIVVEWRERRVFSTCKYVNFKKMKCLDMHIPNLLLKYNKTMHNIIIPVNLCIIYNHKSLLINVLLINVLITQTYDYSFLWYCDAFYHSIVKFLCITWPEKLIGIHTSIYIYIFISWG